MFGIGMGPSSNEKQAYGSLASLGGFASHHGQGDISAFEDFYRGIMSGDPTKINTILAPQMKGIRERGQQKIMTASQFGDRSGGTNASLQQTQDQTTSAINEMIDELTAHGADALGSMGANLTGQAGSDFVNQFGEAKTMQEQDQAKWADIFNSISGVVGAVAGMPGIAGSTFGKVLTGAAGAI
jgi:hypothetical protein